MVDHAKAHFAEWPIVEVDRYFNDLSTPGTRQELMGRAERAAQVLYSHFQVRLIEAKNSSNNRVQSEENVFGFLIVHQSSRGDDGYRKRVEAFRVIDSLRRTFAGYRIEITVGAQGESKTAAIQPNSVARLDDMETLCIYQVTWRVQIERQMSYAVTEP